ncbi:MAG: MFS transporter [Candidatus Methanoplasma sp.]|jgi:MFS family permease|nr:MFS transporter [Candidatus Methanoplasma sp.]
MGRFGTGIKEGRYGLMTIVLVWAGFVVTGCMYLTIPLISLFSNIFSAPETDTVWVTSIFAISFAVACIFFGPIAHKVGSKNVIVAGLIGLGVTSAVLGSVNDLTTVIAIRAVQGACAATFSPVALAYVAELFPVHKRVGTIGLISFGFMLSGIIGQVYSSAVTSALGWNQMFTVLAAVYILTALSVLLFIPARSTDGHSIISAFKQIPPLFRNPSLRLAFVVASVELLAFVGMYAVLGSVLTDRFGYSDSDILNARAVGIIGMVLTPLAGPLSRRFGVLKNIFAGLVLAIVGLVLLGLGGSVESLIISSVITVAGISLALPLVISLVGDLGGEQRGIATSTYAFFLFVGASIGPIISVFVLDMAGSALAFCTVALCVLIGVIALPFIRYEPQKI